MHKKSNDEKNKEDLVLTPGGLRSKRSVKHVGPNEVVRRSENGTYAVVPREQISNDEMKSESEE
jgi:hypothetical protein